MSAVKVSIELTKIRSAQNLVDRQKESPALWFPPTTSMELLLQAEIKRLHFVIRNSFYIPGNELMAEPFGKFDEAWKAYPLKKGRKEALRYYNSSVKNAQDHADLMLAIDNYIRYTTKVNSNRRGDPCPWLNGKTFFNNWRDDWLNFEPPPEFKSAPSSFQEQEIEDFRKEMELEI